MQLGDFTLTTICGGRFRIDGGTMFGVVPKAIWNRVCPADEKNNIPQTTNCLLVQSQDRTVLIDTGYGSKLTDKARRRLGADEGDPLLESLQSAEVKPTDIDTVILTHLHFDHAGGCTRYDEAGQVVPAFPNAEYIVQQQEWTTAAAQCAELAAAYPTEHFLPLEHTGQLRLIEGDTEILPGIRSHVTGGHTEAHQILYIESRSQTAVYLADLCPTSHHLPTSWCMSYDVNVLQTRRMKRRVLGETADGGWLALFDHDPTHAAGRLERTKGGEFVLGEGVQGRP